MNKVSLTCLGLLALALPVLGQSPAPSPAAAFSPGTAPTPMASMTISVSPTQTPAGTATPADDSDSADKSIDDAIERKINRHFNIKIDRDKHRDHDVDDTPWIAVPIITIIFLAIFGMPVLIVLTIMYFSFSKSRAMHRTVRLMVEKGQPVPEALLNPPPVVRQRSDLRRGVKLLMIGVGLMIFFGAVNDWEGGVWSLGIIPFLIGLGYLLVWRLDVNREDSSSKDLSPKDPSPKV